MTKVKIKELAQEIISLVGGKENVTFFTHCMTRLRFNVKDRSLINEEKIHELDGVIGSQWSGEQYQIILGAIVTDVYESICQTEGFQFQQDELEEKKNKQKFSFNVIIDGIVGCITPILPVIICGGMIKAVIVIAEIFGILSPEMSTYQILTFAGDAAFYFLPIFIGASAAKKFGANMGLGMLLGAILIHPSFITALSEGSLSVYGIPVYNANYTNSIFPIILSVWVMAVIEKQVSKFIPNLLKTICEPLLTIMIILPIALCLIGPLGFILGNYISMTVYWLYDTLGFFGVGIFAAIYPLFVITGTHSGFAPYLFQSMTSLGYDPFFITATTITNMNQGISCLAVAIKSKNQNTKSVAISSATTAIVSGVTEPALFGVNLRYKTPLISVMIGSFVGAMIAGFGHSFAYALGGSGIFFFTCFLSGGTSNLLWMIAGIISGAIVTFICTLIMYKDEE